MLRTVQRFIRFIPNLLTLANLFLGCVGIVYAFEDKIYYSAWLILAAAIIDFFDGFVARTLKATSSIGKELDSLSDAVTFGVLPGMIYYHFLSIAFASQNQALDTPEYLLYLAFLIPICGVYRLAKFNTTNQEMEFRGLAIPAQALFAGSLVVIYYQNIFGLASLLVNVWIIILFIVLFSWLMVSDIPMFALKTKSLQWKGNEIKILFAGIAALLFILFGYAGIGIAVILYILISILNNTFVASKT
jgi:CDP-diacylglycerol---serine O-phosphatidyltransferase